MRKIIAISLAAFLTACSGALQPGAGLFGNKSAPLRPGDYITTYENGSPVYYYDGAWHKTKPKR